MVLKQASVHSIGHSLLVDFQETLLKKARVRELFEKELTREGIRCPGETNTSLRWPLHSVAENVSPTDQHLQHRRHVSCVVLLSCRPVGAFEPQRGGQTTQGRKLSFFVGSPHLFRLFFFFFFQVY